MVSQYENGPDFQTPNEARIAELEETVSELTREAGELRKRLLSRLIYPVSKEINPRGWELRETPMLEEAVRFILEPA